MGYDFLRRWLRRPRWWRMPPYGSRRHRLRRWLADRRPITRGRHERLLAEQRRQWDAARRRAVDEAGADADRLVRELVPRIAAAGVAWSSGAFRLELWVTAPGRDAGLVWDRSCCRHAFGRALRR